MKLPLLLAGYLLAVTLHGEKVISNTAFGTTGIPVEHDFLAAGKGRFHGSLPAGWKENYAAAADTDANVESMPQRDGKGPFLRFTVKSTGKFGTPARFIHPLPPLKVGIRYRIKAEVRVHSSGELRFYFREQGSPYRAFGMVKHQGNGEWANVISDIRITNRDYQLNRSALFFELVGRGEFDLRTVTATELPAENADKVLLKTIFTEKLEHTRTERQGVFNGFLPIPWQEDFTHWCPNTVIHTKTVNEQNSFYLRFFISKKKQDSSFPGFRAPIGQLEKGTTYELSTLAANYTTDDVRVTIRQIKHPYQAVAALRIPPGSWRNFRLRTIFTGKIEGELGVFINFDGTGTFDIASLKLAECPPGDDQLKRPAPQSPNYLANTCFPLGLPAGWNLDQWRANGSVTADSSVIGPSGVPALKLSFGGMNHYKGRALAIYSAPFITAESGEENTCSFSYKGEGDYSVVLRTQNGTILAKRNLPSTEGKWKRIAIPFTSAPDDDSIALHLTSIRGDLHFDALRVCQGREEEYQMQMANEVSLAVSPGDASLARIRYIDEKPLFDYYIAGDSRPAELKLTAFDLYGNEHPQPSIQFDGHTRRGSVELRLPIDRQLGQFRIEASLLRDGVAASPVSELILTQIERPHYDGREAPANSPFGIHVNPYDLGLTAIKAAGCTQVRTHDAGMPYIGWAFLEKEPGKWTFYDAELMMYRQYGLRILGELGTCPPWASYYSKNHVNDPEAKNHYAPVNREAFANYVRTVAKRYKGIIDEWTFWNEPSLSAGWRTNRIARGDGSYTIDKGKNPAEEYVEFSKIAYHNLRAVNPDAKLIAHYADVNGWTEQLHAAGAGSVCDGIEFHSYLNHKTGFPGDGLKEELEEKLAPLPRPLRPLWLTEGQGASRGNDVGDLSRRYAGMYRHTLPWKNEEEYMNTADNTVRFTIALLASGVKKVFLYSAHCFIALVHRPNYMALVGADGYPHPMLAAYSAMTRRLEGKRFVTTRLLAPGIPAHIFSDGKNSVAAITGDDNTGVLSCTLSGAEWADLYGNPVMAPAKYQGQTLYLSAQVPAQILQDSLSVTK